MTGMRTPGSGGGGGGSSSSGPLVALYVATAGLQGNALGSDEEEITLLVYVLLDESQNKVTQSKEDRKIERRREREREGERNRSRREAEVVRYGRVDSLGLGFTFSLHHPRCAVPTAIENRRAQSRK